MAWIAGVFRLAVIARAGVSPAEVVRITRLPPGLSSRRYNADKALLTAVLGVPRLDQNGNVI
jgi:hypothetical protein